VKIINTAVDCTWRTSCSGSDLRWRSCCNETDVLKLAARYRQLLDGRHACWPCDRRSLDGNRHRLVRHLIAQPTQIHILNKTSLCRSMQTYSQTRVIGPIPWGHSGPLSRVVVVDIDAQAARDSTGSNTC